MDIRLLFIFALMTLSPMGMSYEQHMYYQPTELEFGIHELINDYRQELGKNTLILDDALSDIALNHVWYMIDQGAISHDNFSQRSREMTAGLTDWNTAENVAMGYNTAEKAVTGWLDSPGHRKNIEGKYTHTGIAARKNSEGRYYFCQVFLRK